MVVSVSPTKLVDSTVSRELRQISGTEETLISRFKLITIDT